MLVVRVRDRTGMGSVPPPRGVLIEAGHPNILYRILTKVKKDEKVFRFFKIVSKKLYIKNVRMNAFLLINRSADLDLNKNKNKVAGGCSQETTHKFNSMRF